MTVLKTFEFNGCKRVGKYIWWPKDGGEKWSEDYLTICVAARQVLEEQKPMTVRQCYYALFSAGFINNSQHDYKQVVNALVQGRQRGIIPWSFIEDRTRRPHEVSMYADLSEFMGVVRNAYRRDVWQTQPRYCEFWVEKDALSGIVRDECEPFGVTLNVGRGYDGWSSIKNAATRFIEREERTGEETSIFYLGDFDPSGEDMVRSMRERLASLGCRPDIQKIAITDDDIRRYKLPQAPGKETDSRSAGFIEEHGKLIQVELDALPVKVLRKRIKDTITGFMDMHALDECRAEEEADNERLSDFIDKLEAE